ncbi:site-specific integrase [Streptomyces termitum]
MSTVTSALATPRPHRFESLTTGREPAVPHLRPGQPVARPVRTRLYTGLRRSELLGLRWTDLGLDEGTAGIRRTLQRTATGGLTTLLTKTRASERRIAYPTRCAHSPKLHHEQQKTEREAAGTTWQHDGHMFTTAQDTPIAPTNLTHTFTTLFRKAGLCRIRFHDLRRSTATLLLEQDVELVVIKELLGHAHIGVTATAHAHAHAHAHARIRLQRDTIDTLSTVLGTPGIRESLRGPNKGVGRVGG